MDIPLIKVALKPILSASLPVNGFKILKTIAGGTSAKPDFKTETCKTVW